MQVPSSAVSTQRIEISQRIQRTYLWSNVFEHANGYNPIERILRAIEGAVVLYTVLDQLCCVWGWGMGWVRGLGQVGGAGKGYPGTGQVGGSMGGEVG